MGKYDLNVFGLLLALIWVVFFHQRIPVTWFIKGVIYCIILSLLAGLIISPLAMLAAGDSVGIFYHDTWFPGRIIVAGLLMHLGYGIAILLCLKYAGVGGMEGNETLRIS